MNEKRRLSNGNGASTSWMNSTSPLLPLSEFLAKNSEESFILKRMLETPRALIRARREAQFSPEIVDFLEGLDRRKQADQRLPQLDQWKSCTHGGF